MDDGERMRVVSSGSGLRAVASAARKSYRPLVC